VSKTLIKKLIYVIAALAMLALLIPAMAVPVSAQTGVGNLNMTLIDPLTNQNVSDSGWNVAGSRVQVDLTGNTQPVTFWNIQPLAEAGDGPAQFASPYGADVTSVLVQGVTGDYEIVVNFADNSTLSIEKKFGKIDYTTLDNGPGSSPVTWVESQKKWTGTANITDTVTGNFQEEGGVVTNAAQGTILNWYLIDPEETVDLSAGETPALTSRMEGYDTPNLVTFSNGETSIQTVTGQDGSSTVTLDAAGEEAVDVVVVPQYPNFETVNVNVTPEMTTYDFYTTENEVVPQVRWAGEKIVLEKNFGTSYEGNWVKFSLQNQSVGSLEGITGVSNYVDSQAVWTRVDSKGFASVILTSSDEGVSQVTAALYNYKGSSPGTGISGTLINQHYFTVYWLKLEKITLGDVAGKRALHNDGLWQLPSDVQPSNPWDPSGSYNGTVDPAIPDSPTQTLNVSQDALLRAKVWGWFTSSNPSTRPQRTVDPTDSTLNNPETATLTLPAGRWILPDDWAALAGPNWQQSRLHWDIMCNPDGSVGATDETGDYLMPPLTGALVGASDVIGPFSPGLELMTPMGWQIPNPGYDPQYRDDMNTVVPDGNLNAWDAPMPPAKVIFQIQPAASTMGVAGYFKPAEKEDIYYIYIGTTQVFTNPFYEEMIPAHPAIPAFINNGGYDWNSFDESYGPYEFWTFINQNSFTPLVPTSDPTNHPTVVEVYSDNHGEAMVYLNGNWNLDLTNWSAKGYADVPINAVVGMTTVQATADYPYSRLHQAFQSNMDVKTWTWGGQVLGTDQHTFGDGSMGPASAATRMVIAAGTWDPATVIGTFPNQKAASMDKVVWVWVTDRDGMQAGVMGAQVSWTIGDGTQAEWNTTANGYLSHYNSVTGNITLSGGFLSNTSGMVVDATHATSILRAPTSWEVQLFNKFFGNGGTSSIRADASDYCVAAVDVDSLTGDTSGATNIQIKITSHDFDAVMGQAVPGTVTYNTNVYFANQDPLDDGIRIGDANCDGVVNMGDVTAVEKMILGKARVSSDAVLNNDGTVDMGTVVKIERIILGLP